MSKSRSLYLIYLALMLVVLGSLVFLQIPVSAQTETPTPTPSPSTTPDQLKLETTYPSISENSGATFNFSVDIKYSGSRQLFNLDSTAPQGWEVSFNNSAGKNITGVQLGPVDYTVTETVSVNMTPALGQSPAPGDYPLTITVSSGNLSQTINLKATVKAKFEFNLSTDTGALNASGVAGKENHASILVNNTGSASVDKINLTSTKPDGWIVNFNPATIDSIGAGQTKQVDVVITPPGGNTVSGDYAVGITASNGTLSQTMNLRVTVSTPTIWGWVGLIIVIAVIAGLAVLFMKLGRR
jgi:uncharacterized membrane protein